MSTSDYCWTSTPARCSTACWSAANPSPTYSPSNSSASSSTEKPPSNPAAPPWRAAKQQPNAAHGHAGPHRALPHRDETPEDPHPRSQPSSQPLSGTPRPTVPAARTRPQRQNEHTTEQHQGLPVRAGSGQAVGSPAEGLRQRPAAHRRSPAVDGHGRPTNLPPYAGS